MENIATAPNTAPSTVQPQLTLRVLKEPRGFIRLVQFLFAILAFSTTCGFSTEIAFRFACNAAQTFSYDRDLEYPFDLARMLVLDCAGRGKPVVLGDYSSQSEYFVATGVLSFLYCIVAVALYVFYDALYKANIFAPVFDLAISGVLALFWLTASSSWAQGVSDMKYFTNPKTIFKKISDCQTPDSCIVLSSGNFATLNVSLIIGFANFVLWVAGLWFIYKESHWFKNRQAALNQTPPLPSGRA